VCAKADIALVGLHIMIKTHYRPQWLWSTFEQVDNVPPAVRQQFGVRLCVAGVLRARPET